AAKSLTRVEEFSRHQLLAGSDVLCERTRIILDRQPLDRIAAGVVFKCLFVLSVIFQRLAEGELQMHSILATDFGTRELALHLEDFVVTETIALQSRQAPIGIPGCGAEFDSSTVGRDALITLAHAS